jgi:hypothetical protein
MIRIPEPPPLRNLDPRLDRREQFDPRSRNYPARALVKTRRRQTKLWRCGVTLDQGANGSCVGFAWSAEAAAEPVVVAGITDDSAYALYRRAQELDEWEGDDYEGTSVLAGAKAAMEQGWLTEYRWAFGEDDLALAIGYLGPAVIGIPWYSRMSTPNRQGRISTGGYYAGGHAILVTGYSSPTMSYLLHNSWGPSWGIRGGAWIGRTALSWLLQRGGEACIPLMRVADSSP